MHDREPTLQIVYLRDDGLLLTKKQYGSWREIQAEYNNYMASIGPLTVAGAIAFFEIEYGTAAPFTPQEIEEFAASAEEVTVSTR